MQEWGNCNFTSILHSNLSSSVNQMIGVGVASVNLLKIKHNLPMLKQHNPMNKKRIIRNQLTSSLRHNITSELKWGKIINSYPELPHLKSYRPCTLATNSDVKKALDTRHNYDIREEERTRISNGRKVNEECGQFLQSAHAQCSERDVSWRQDVTYKVYLRYF